ncbi:1-acyl-sn-glycerol-3-phosphate acyltransferase [Frankia sp. CcI6]|uniref:lysophospholipid acyltransferase family protein n=1 Tax=unclassified Frankia TaxID=2632575 RepID=UPI0003D034EB|nr:MULTISPECIES: lysophospholipid acyltransferase family protein [unclassified Frankia]OAA23096.1 1-acyl-sn-glycerol-3-phosphate acyltransferase [Frankia casuarinae]ETA01353.1 1-acyl-sn-glycerol-3-phosphate acyltransferase [Frankia sp. CcI6]KDA42519.1 1-acyl-sn-glycerol-3-phosphate acyltransferase [Frankia sp. BMG5.23]KEZ35609.1 1-acyl-sn-glycerol-3-phosphate acyltransferase [Frankia sp. CeD]KFB03948.1 1-acyl-sn-glycerol-3-phosphate acyltransferase [Frankia sp. Allo2]
MAGRPRRGVGLRAVLAGWRPGGRGPVPGSAEAHRVPEVPREFPTAWARRPAARAARGVFLRGVMRPLLRTTLTVAVHGAEAFDGVRDTPVIIVSNHSSHLDAPLLLCTVPGWVRARTVVTAAADYFFDSAWRGASSAFAFATVPIERHGGAPSATPMNLLGDGWNLVIFPEGTRSRDGARGRFRLGAAYLAINAGVPVVPVGLRGAYAAMPRGRSWPVAGRPPVSVRFGRPMRPAPGEDVRAFTARLAAEVDRLCAEDATSWWEATRAAFASGLPGAAGLPDTAGTAEEARVGDAAQVPAARSAPDVAATPAGSEPAGRTAGDPGGAAGGGGFPGRTSPRAVPRPGGTGGTGGAAGSAAVSARLRGAPNTPTARWRRIWAATEPAPRPGSRSPWRR